MRNLFSGCALTKPSHNCIERYTGSANTNGAVSVYLQWDWLGFNQKCHIIVSMNRFIWTFETTHHTLLR